MQNHQLEHALRVQKHKTTCLVHSVDMEVSPVLREEKICEDSLVNGHIVASDLADDIRIISEENTLNIDKLVNEELGSFMEDDFDETISKYCEISMNGIPNKNEKVSFLENSFITEISEKAHPPLVSQKREITDFDDQNGEENQMESNSLIKKHNTLHAISNSVVESESLNITNVVIDLQKTGSKAVSINSNFIIDSDQGEVTNKANSPRNDDVEIISVIKHDERERTTAKNMRSQRQICYKEDESGVVGMFLCVKDNCDGNKREVNTDVTVEEYDSDVTIVEDSQTFSENDRKVQETDVLQKHHSDAISKEDSERICREVENFFGQPLMMKSLPSEQNETLKNSTNCPKQFPKLLSVLSEPLKLPALQKIGDNSRTTKTSPHQNKNQKFPALFGALTNHENDSLLSKVLKNPIKLESNEISGPSENNTPSQLNSSQTFFSNLLEALSHKAMADSQPSVKRHFDEISSHTSQLSIKRHKRKSSKPRQLKKNIVKTKKEKCPKKIKTTLKTVIKLENYVNLDDVVPPKIKRVKQESDPPVIPNEHFTNKVGFVKKEAKTVHDDPSLSAPPLPVGLYPEKTEKGQPNEVIVDLSKPCSCNICGKVYVEFSDLEYHIKGHLGERPFKCNLCERTFKHSQNLYRHRRTHSGEKPYVCDVCNKTFIDSSSMRKHRRTHNPEKSEFCSICSKGFVSRINLKHHMVIHLKDKPFKCEYCQKGFNKNANLKMHMKVHLGYKPWKCDVCGKEFPEKNRLKMHERIHWVDKPYKCTICPAQFAQISNLYVHLKKHKGDKPWKCGQCGKCFMMKSYLSQHIRRHTGERQFKCAVCGKEYFQRGEFNRHMRTHTGERNHVCSICDERFIDSGALKTHVRGVHEGKMFHCKFCNKEFLRDSNLRRHEAIHTGTKKHFCGICNAGFLFKVDLKDHMNKHAGFKPHACDICGKRYYKTSELNQHKKIHTGEEMIYCEACEKTFNYKQSYIKHCESERHARKVKAAEGGESNADLKKSKAKSKRKTFENVNDGESSCDSIFSLDEGKSSEDDKSEDDDGENISSEEKSNSGSLESNENHPINTCNTTENNVSRDMVVKTVTVNGIET